jgi:hypothetical protein
MFPAGEAALEKAREEKIEERKEMKVPTSRGTLVRYRKSDKDENSKRIELPGYCTDGNEEASVVEKTVWWIIAPKLHSKQRACTMSRKHCSYCQVYPIGTPCSVTHVQ